VPKETYKTDEIIDLTFSLRNTGSESLIVNKRMAYHLAGYPSTLWDITFVITDSTGKRRDDASSQHAFTSF
jgi:hypothetical protein